MSRIRRHVFVSGRVQGVFFRANCREVAKSLGVAGFVKNLPDGRVEAVFEGLEDDVKKMLEWVRKGPPGARVTNVEILEEKPQGLTDFRIEY